MSTGSYREGGEHNSADDVPPQHLQWLVNVLQHKHPIFSPFSHLNIKLIMSGCTGLIRVCQKGWEQMGDRIMIVYLGCEKDPVSSLAGVCQDHISKPTFYLKWLAVTWVSEIRHSSQISQISQARPSAWVVSEIRYSSHSDAQMLKSLSHSSHSSHSVSQISSHSVI